MEEVKAQIPKNTAIFYIKFIAIISVICAHCGAINENANRFTTICASILDRVGAIGVGCFLIVSGALFNPNKQSFGFMMKKKLIKIGIPWLFGATVVYFYEAIRKLPILFLGLVKMLFGYGSYFYYLTILFICFIIFSIPFMNNIYAKLICVIITLVSVIFWAEKGFLTPYLDITNWIGYFALGGIIAENKDGFEKIVNKILPFSPIIFVVCIILETFVGGAYWGGVKPLVNFTAIVSVLLLGTVLGKGKRLKEIEFIGNNSLFIYIWHMPIAGIVAWAFNKLEFLSYLTLIRPFVVLLVVYVAMIIVKYLGKTIQLIVGFNGRKD